MMSHPFLEVIAPGLLTTVQDLGRPGYARYGVSPGGAVDDFALRAANFLVDNPPEAAGLEITLIGPTLRFTSSCSFAVCGADLGAALDDHPIETWRGHLARAGQVLTFTGQRRGCRAYLSVHGGLAVPPVLGSRSTDLRAGLGWGGGRPLRSGDRLPVGGGPIGVARLDLLAGDFERLLPSGDVVPGDYLERTVVSAAPGPQEDHFDRSAVKLFYSAEFTVGGDSDRMGLRLHGPAVIPRSADIVSDGLVAGAVQIPESGQPLCLLAGHQTTGGYPKIAVVGLAHLRGLAQLEPLSKVSFNRVGQEELEEEDAAYINAVRGLEARRLGQPAARLYRMRSGPVCRVSRVK